MSQNKKYKQNCSMLKMIKNILKLIQKHKANSGYIYDVVDMAYVCDGDYDLFCTSKIKFNYKLSSLHLQKLVKWSDFQEHALMKHKEINNVNKKIFRGFEFTHTQLNKWGMRSVQKAQKINFHSLNSLMRIHTYCNLQDKSSKQSLQKNSNIESKEELEEQWGGPDALKLIIFLKEDFHEVVKKHKEILVFFSARWCRHCLKLRKPFGHAALMAKEANLPVTFATFDININPDIADANGVVGIPTIKYFKDGKFLSDYRGPRNSDGLFEYAKNPQQHPTDIIQAEV